MFFYFGLAFFAGRHVEYAVCRKSSQVSPVDEEIRSALNGRPSRFRSLLSKWCWIMRPAPGSQLEAIVPRRWIGRSHHSRNLFQRISVGLTAFSPNL